MTRIVFMGTPEFAVPTLTTLAKSYDIAAVYSQTPIFKGRKQKGLTHPVIGAATELGIETRYTAHFKSEQSVGQLRALNADFFVIVAFGIKLPQEVLDLPKYDCINGHASILPKWRGAAPVQRAIEAGDKQTGISVISMRESIDTGPVIATKTCDILDTDTSATLHNKLSIINAELISRVIKSYDKFSATPQDQDKVSYAKKLTTTEGRIDWTKSAKEINQKIRAFTPKPGAWFYNGENKVKVMKTSVVDKQTTHEPGSFIGVDKQNGLNIATGNGILVLQELQPANRNKMNAIDYYNGYGELCIN